MNIITGGSSGIGLAIAEGLSQKQQSATLLDLKPPTTLPDHCRYIHCDCADPEQVQAAISQIESPITSLIYSAGINLIASLEDTHPEKLQQLFASNTFGAYYTIQAVLPQMKAHQHGRIILMGSEQAFIGRKLGTAYGMSKAALVQLTKALADELKLHPNVHIHCLCPASVADTPMTEQAAEQLAAIWNCSKSEALRRFDQDYPSGKMITKAEIVEQVITLIAATDTTHEPIIPMDGSINP